MRSFFRSFFASVLAILVVIVVIMGVLVARTSSKSEIRDGSWLVIDLYGQIEEYSPPGGVMSEIVGGKAETLNRILLNLEKASVDDRIEGVVLKMSSSHTAGMAMLEEIRAAVKRVRDSGRKVIGFADSMDRRTYYLAASCDSLFMPPTAYMNYLGYGMTTTYVLGTLEKLDIEENMHRIEDYKSAAEMLMRKDMSPTVRENRQWMLDGYWDLYCEALEDDRGISEEKILAMMERALIAMEVAEAEGFIDGIRYWDEVEDSLKEDDDEVLATVSQSRYEEEKPEDLGLKGDEKIAVIHAQGSIGGRKNRVDPVLGIMMGHESVIAELRRAQEDDDVAAIVFRVNSGGGEALASDLMGHQVEVTAGVKPVVVSMVDVAGSGGYHISYRGTRILADENTVTGSIGSISGKMNISGLHDKLGITHDFMTKGPHGLFYSPYRNFTEEEWEIFRADHWRGFNDWLRDVADHRGMTFEEAEKLAMGRIFTGRQGAENGLVDEVGDLARAIDVAKELAGIEKDEKVTVAHYPEKKSFIQELFGGNIAAVARYTLYRFIRDDLAQTWNSLNSPAMRMERIDIE